MDCGILIDPEGLAALAADCRPLNIFGTSFASPEAAALQQQALDYAFKDSISDGANRLQVLSVNTPAIKLYERSGYRKTGEIPNMFLLDGKHYSYTFMTRRLR